MSRIGKLSAVAVLCTLWPALSVGLAQTTYVKVADEWGTIQPGGPRPAANGNRFWNIQGADAGANASSATLRFYLDGLISQLNTDFPGGWQVENVTLVTEHDDGGFSMPGGVSVFHFTNDALAITNGMDSFFPDPPPDAPPGNFGTLTPSPLVFDDTGTSDGEPVRVLLNDFVTPADMGDVTRVSDYMFTLQGDDNLDVLGTSGGVVDPAGATNATPHYDLSFPTANADDTLSTFENELATDMGDWISAGLDAIVSDIVDGTDALSFIFATTDAASTAAATYKGNAFNNRFPPRIYIEVSGMGTQELLGDYNENNIVDAADYTVWQDNFGSATSLPNDDTPGVGPDDFTRWTTNFGSTPGSGGALSAAAVPEPMSIAVAVLGMAGLTFIRLRSRG